MDKYHSVRENLSERGWAVVENVLEPELCDSLVDDIWKWLEGLGTGIKRSDPGTHTASRWPVSIHGLIQHYEVGHQAFCWKARKHPKVIEAFQAIWGTDRLLVSFDGICVFRPRSKTYKSKSWLHTDQSSKKQGRHCIQGVLNLTEITDSHGTLQVLDRGHKKHAEVMNAVKKADDFHVFDKEQLEKLGTSTDLVRVTGGKGSLMLWDSRTPHQNVPALDPSLPRFAIYVSMQPAHAIKPDALKRKRQAYEDYRMTTHWSASTVRLFSKSPRTYGKEMPEYPLVSLRNRDTVEDKTVLKLAGVLPY